MAWSDTYDWYPATSDYSEALTDDSRNCRVSGCPRKHSYITIGGRRIYSKYCLSHTCHRIFPVEEGYHCQNPKEVDDKYCTAHLKCGEPGCERLGEYHGPSEYVQWFCSRHRCTAPNCRAKAHDRQQQRCEAHFTKCSVAGCTRPCHLHRDGTLDLVCAVHYGTFKCASAGCTRRKPGYNMKYCLAHECSVEGCSSGRDTAGSHVCTAHRCTTPSCLNALAAPSQPTSFTCLDHTCRTPRCLHARSSPTADFCRTHTCLLPTCPREARFPAGYCDARHACVVPTCTKPRMSAVGPGAGNLAPGGAMDRNERCAEHAHFRERRAASMESRMPPPVDLEGLRERFRLGGDRKRLSDDIEGMRRRERERELERLRGDLEDVYAGGRYKRWEGPWDDCERWL